MKKFTVILLYPDYSTDNYGETWCNTVNAYNCVQAVEVAQRKCAKESTVIESAEDLLPVSVFEGAHEDLVGHWAIAQDHEIPAQVRVA